jgi:hypothetical protein
MSDADYQAALDSARAEVKKAIPKWPDADVETEATKRADQAKYQAEHILSTRASSSFEVKNRNDKDRTADEDTAQAQKNRIDHSTRF